MSKNKNRVKPGKAVPRKLSEDERRANHAKTRARKARKHNKKYASVPTNGYESKGAEKRARQQSEREAKKLRIREKKEAIKLEKEAAEQFGPVPFGKEHHQLRNGHVVLGTGRMWDSQTGRFVLETDLHKERLEQGIQAVRDRWEQDEWLFVVPKGWVKPSDTLLPHLYKVITGEEYVAPKAVKRFTVVNRAPATVAPKAKGARLSWEQRQFLSNGKRLKYSLGEACPTLA